MRYTTHTPSPLSNLKNKMEKVADCSLLLLS
jgi:hypothetical protein